MERNFIIHTSRLIPNFNYHNNYEATVQLITLLDSLSKNKIKTPDEYANVYHSNFFTYKTWEELVDSEKYSRYGFDEKKLHREFNKSIWRLPCGWYIQRV